MIKKEKGIKLSCYLQNKIIRLLCRYINDNTGIKTDEISIEKRKSLCQLKLSIALVCWDWMKMIGPGLKVSVDSFYLTGSQFSILKFDKIRYLKITNTPNLNDKQFVMEIINKHIRNLKNLTKLYVTGYSDHLHLFEFKNIKIKVLDSTNHNYQKNINNLNNININNDNNNNNNDNDIINNNDQEEQQQQLLSSSSSSSFSYSSNASSSSDSSICNFINNLPANIKQIGGIHIKETYRPEKIIELFSKCKIKAIDIEFYQENLFPFKEMVIRDNSLIHLLDLSYTDNLSIEQLYYILKGSPRLKSLSIGLCYDNLIYYLSKKQTKPCECTSIDLIEDTLNKLNNDNRNHDDHHLTVSIFDQFIKFQKEWEFISNAITNSETLKTFSIEHVCRYSVGLFHKLVSIPLDFINAIGDMISSNNSIQKLMVFDLHTPQLFQYILSSDNTKIVDFYSSIVKLNNNNNGSVAVGGSSVINNCRGNDNENTTINNNNEEGALNFNQQLYIDSINQQLYHLKNQHINSFYVDAFLSDNHKKKIINYNKSIDTNK